MDQPHIRVLPDPASIAREVAEFIVHQASLCAKEARMFSLFLSGGSGPKALFELLASDEFKSQIDWRGVELYWGDERCVAPTDELSNYKLANDLLISKVPIPPANVHRMKGEINPEQAAKEYGQLLRAQFMDEGPDVLLLGMGDDGHTASLFPGTKALYEMDHRCVANWVEKDYIPKGTNWRITLTYPFINRSREIIVLVTGASKAKRVQEVLEGDEDVERLPIQGVKPHNGNLTWYIDVAAAGMNELDE